MTQFVCFLATLRAKLLRCFETPEVSQDHKQNQCKLFMNIMFLYLQFGKPCYYHYPLRAIAEFFISQRTSRELSKRLNAESLLKYKQQKEVLGTHILDEFDKKLTVDVKESRSEINLSSANFDQIYEDVENELSDVISKLGSQQNENCFGFVLCLKIASQLIRRQMQILEELKQDGKGGKRALDRKQNPSYQTLR